MRKEFLKINWKVLILSLLVVFSIGFIGGLFTSESVDTDWYDSIKPDITPPGWVFPVAWNIIYLFIAFSFYFSWTSAKNKDIKRNLLILFGVNLFFNVLWSYLFFGLRLPGLAFVDLIFIWITIIFMMVFTKKIDMKSFYLLVPYFLWVTFAGVLNGLIAF
ncbi:MAG: TspO/MBR family protein [Candidatus Pacearchaeota archaeon]